LIRLQGISAAGVALKLSSRRLLTALLLAGAGFAVTLFLFHTFNPIIVIVTGLVFLLTVFALKDITYGVIAFLAILPFIDFFKRFLFIFDTTKVEYFLVKSLPDLIPLGMILYLVGDRRLQQGRSRLDKWVLFFSLWVLLEAFNPRSPIIVGLGGIHLYIIPLLLYFYSRELVAKDRWKPAMFVILGTAVISSFYGIYQFKFGMPGFEEAWVNSPMVSSRKLDMITIRGFLRAYAGFTSHKEFGFFLAVSMLVTLFAPIRLHALVRLLLFALFSVALVMTFHRASLLAFLAGVVVYFIVRYRRKGLFDLTAVGLVVSPLLVPLLGNALVGLKTLFKQPLLYALLQTGTFDARVRGFHRAFQNLGSTLDPIGHGLGSVFIGIRIANIRQVIEVPHNGYLEMLWEIGSIGTLLFILLVVHFFFLSRKLMMMDLPPEDKRLAALCIGLLSGILLTHGLINAFTQMYHTAAYFWVFAGILTGIWARNETGAEGMTGLYEKSPPGPAREA